MSDTSTKQCTVCGRVQTIDNFRAHKNYRDGHAHDCRTCHAAAERRRRGGTKILLYEIPADILTSVRAVLEDTGTSPQVYLDKLVRSDLARRRPRK